MGSGIKGKDHNAGYAGNDGKRNRVDYEFGSILWEGICLKAQSLPMPSGTPKSLLLYLMGRLALRRASSHSRPEPINSRATVRLSGFTELRTQMGTRA